MFSGPIELKTKGKKPRASHKRAFRFRCLNPQVRPLFGNGSEYTHIRHACGYCEGCQRNQLNDLIGRVGAHALTCSYIDFVTLTYDDSKGVHERAAALIRIGEDVQKFQKRLRALERYALQKHNETCDPSQRVSTERSYIKFLTVPERGKKGRMHFHVLVMWESHFPVPPEILETGDISRCNPHTRRVWDLPVITGKETKYMPSGAKDPEVIDFRVRKKKMPDGRVTGGNQVHKTWPHGYVNWQRVTHHTDSAQMTLKPSHELAESVRYIQKYMRKAQRHKMAYERQRLYSEADWHDYKFHLKKGVIRSQSRGLGHDYARSVAARYAQLGLSLDPLFRLEGFVAKLKPETQHKRHEALAARGLDATRQVQLTEDRITFEMRGSMRNAMIEEYLRLRRHKVPHSEAIIKYHHEQVTEKLRKYLASAEAHIARIYSARLPEKIEPVRAYELDHEGREMLGIKGHDDLSEDLKIRPAKERLEEREEFAQKTYAQYEAVLAQLAVHEKYQLVKKEVGACSASLLLTEEQFKNRPQVEVDAFRREWDANDVKQQIKKLEQKAKGGCEDSFEILQYVDEYRRRTERVEFGLPRHDVWHTMAHSRILWRWICTCDDYNFPDIREEIVNRFCQVENEGNAQLVITPRGERFVRRQVYAPGRMFVFLGDEKTSETRINRGRKVWAARKLPDHVSDWRLVPLRAPSDRAMMFHGLEPLRI